MNKTAIKNYAVDARKKWIQAIAQQAAFYGCAENSILDDETMAKELADKGIFLAPKEKGARESLIKDIKNKGYQNTIEEVAYTWFNRLVAIRYMEVNGYLPNSIRILSSIDSERIEPDCIREYARLDFIEQDTAAALAEESDDKLFRYILVEQCKALGEIMPKMFNHLAGYATLLLPERLYIKDGLVHDLTHAISEEDFGEQVEIIGWLYQYYISELNEMVYDGGMSKGRIPKELVSAATTIYTPDWVVRYMVENSLGKLWMEQHPNSNLRKDWKYYLDEAEQTPEVEAQLRTLVKQNPISKPEEIRLIDPCMGSGHILVYAFDVFFQIYQSIGYAERDIPDLIIENNIYGLDIDERACQLAYFALMMKARSYNRRFFRRREVPQPQVYSPQGYEEGREYGSLVKVDELEDKPTEKESYMLFDMSFEQEMNTWNFRRLLHQKYDVVVTNPPYLSSSRCGAKLAEYMAEEYPEGKADMSMAMYLHALRDLSFPNGFVSFITTSSWMFLSSFEKLRSYVVSNHDFDSLVDFGSELFDGKVGHNLIVAWVNRNSRVNKNMVAIRLVQYNYSRRDEKQMEYFNFSNYYISHPDNFIKIPGSPIAYWVSKNFIANFEKGIGIGNISDFTGSQHKTADNARFLRMFWELPNSEIHAKKWIFYIKGGEFRRWYGNIDLMIDWSQTAKQFYTTNQTSNMINERFHFKKGITYTSLTSSVNGFRYLPQIGIFDIKGPSIIDVQHLYYCLAFLIARLQIIILRCLIQLSHYKSRM